MVSMSVRRLRDLLTELMWDAPDEVEPEVQRAVSDNAVKETFEMYQQVWREYNQVKELPGQENWLGHTKR
jgi:hypothetical protein